MFGLCDADGQRSVWGWNCNVITYIYFRLKNWNNINTFVVVVVVKLLA